MLFRQLFDLGSSTYSYLLACPDTHQAVLIDPVLEQLERDASLIVELGLQLIATLETHVHADHITAADSLRRRFGSRVILSKYSGARQVDEFIQTGDKVTFGHEQLEVRETPGHTSGCVTYVSLGHGLAFTGDALLIRGTGRTDFQQGDARQLFQSIHTQIFTLPDSTLLYPAHDYKGRTVTTVGEEKAFNPRLAQKSVEEFVEIMRQLNLPPPKRLDEALPWNQRCGAPVESVT